MVEEVPGRGRGMAWHLSSRRVGGTDSKRKTGRDMRRVPMLAPCLRPPRLQREPDKSRRRAMTKAWAGHGPRVSSQGHDTWCSFAPRRQQPTTWKRWELRHARPGGPARALGGRAGLHRAKPGLHLIRREGTLFGSLWKAQRMYEPVQYEYCTLHEQPCFAVFGPLSSWARWLGAPPPVWGTVLVLVPAGLDAVVGARCT